MKVKKKKKTSLGSILCLNSQKLFSYSSLFIGKQEKTIKACSFFALRLQKESRSQF